MAFFKVFCASFVFISSEVVPVSTIAVGMPMSYQPFLPSSRSAGAGAGDAGQGPNSQVFGFGYMMNPFAHSF